MFPSIYDNKVICGASNWKFYRSDLGSIYQSCITEEKLKNSGMNIVYDVQNGFTNYEGHSHYHEAAYDAVMTANAFATVVKFMEYEKPKFSKGGKFNKNKPKEDIDGFKASKDKTSK